VTFFYKANGYKTDVIFISDEHFSNFFARVTILTFSAEDQDENEALSFCTCFMSFISSA
jgi:hypothetical protein